MNQGREPRNSNSGWLFLGAFASAIFSIAELCGGFLAPPAALPQTGLSGEAWLYFLKAVAAGAIAVILARSSHQLSQPTGSNRNVQDALAPFVESKVQTRTEIAYHLAIPRTEDGRIIEHGWGIGYVSKGQLGSTIVPELGICYDYAKAVAKVASLNAQIGVSKVAARRMVHRWRG
jgi:hypothetical protein